MNPGCTRVSLPAARSATAPSVVDLGGRLTVAEVPQVCRAIKTALADGADALILDGRALGGADVVGLAALIQSQRLAYTLGVPCVVVPSAQLGREVVEARLADELSLVEAPPLAPPRPEPTAGGAVIARAGRVVLRQPSVSDAVHFRRWGQDPLVEQMVGSDLLYRHRHLPPGDPALVTSLVHDPRAVTALVERAGEPHRARGFVRLYDVELISGFGFVETVVAEQRSASRGLGVDATRLLLAFAQDALQLRRVEAKVYAYNVLSVNALKRNGFQQEGVLRQARIYDGEAWDIFVFSILDTEMTAERARDVSSDFSLFRDEVAS